MAVDYVAVRTQILQGVEFLARRPDRGCEARFLYDVVEDLTTFGVFDEDNPGPALRNAEEAQALRRLGRSIDGVTDAVGKRLFDAPQEFLEHPAWKDVTKSARVALAAMTDGTMAWWRYRDPTGVEGGR